MTTIVKVQKPIFSPPEVKPSWMIYQKGHRGIQLVSDANVAAEIKETFEKEGIFKAYYKAVRTEEGYVIQERVSEQEW